MIYLVCVPRTDGQVQITIYVSREVFVFSESFQLDEIPALHQCCAAWLHDDYECADNHCYKNCLVCKHYNRMSEFDTGLTLLFSKTCFGDQLNLVYKQSEAAKHLYDWAHQHHVRCLLLEPWLKNEEVEL